MKHYIKVCTADFVAAFYDSYPLFWCQ